MKIGGIATAFVLGACIGVGTTWGWMVFGPSVYPCAFLWELRPKDDHRDYSNSTSMPTRELASRLLARVGRTFVADTRYGDQPIYWVGFYEEPKPYGEVLCRVDQVNVPRKIIRGRYGNRQDFWDDDISITRMYAVWKIPGSKNDLTREDACARYRDFGRLIYGKNGDTVERAVNVISDAVNKARLGKVDFKLTCRDARERDHPKSCDGAALLAHLDPRDIFQVEQAETTKTERSERHVDIVYARQGKMLSCHRREQVRLDVVSTQVYGRHAISEGDLQDINIVRANPC